MCHARILVVFSLVFTCRSTFAGEEHSAQIHRNVYVDPSNPPSPTFSSPQPILFEQQPQATFSRYAPSDPLKTKNNYDDDEEDEDNIILFRQPTNRTAVAGAQLFIPLQNSSGIFMPQLVASEHGATEDVTTQMKDLLERLVANQDRRIRPNFGQQPVPVGVTLHISTISSINEVEMDYTLDFYFRQYWEDPRLRFHAPFLKGKVVSVGADFLSRIWVPDTFFPNEKSSFFHSATTTNKFVRISPSGQLEVSVRLTVTAACPMNLTYFPMDRQRCALQVESYGYSTRDIYYYWKPQSPKPSAEVDPNMELPQFEVWPKGGCRNSTIHYVLSTGNYSRLVCEFLFQRTMGYYLIQIYIPASLIVIISWVSFWLSRDSTPSRVTLGVTVVLAMTTLMSGTTASLPKVSYVKSIDVYLGTCFVMVFSSLLEYAAVGYTAKRMKMRRARGRMQSHLARGLFAAGSVGLPVQAAVQAIDEREDFARAHVASMGRGAGGARNVFALMRERDRRESFAVQVDAEGNVISMDDYYGYDNFADPMGRYGSNINEQQYYQHSGEKRPRQWKTLVNRAPSNQLRPQPPKNYLETEPIVSKTSSHSKNKREKPKINLQQQKSSSPSSPPSSVPPASRTTLYASDAFTVPLAERRPSTSSPCSSASLSPPPPLEIVVSSADDEAEPSPKIVNKDADEGRNSSSPTDGDYQQQENYYRNHSSQPPLFMHDGRHGNMRERSEFNPSDIDKYSRIVFPLAFVA